MKKIFMFSIIFLLIGWNSSAEVIVQFEKTFGGVGYDGGYSVKQTLDGGYIIGGLTWSSGSGTRDAYLIKTDANGNALWTKSFAPDKKAMFWSVIQTLDGNYICAGSLTDIGGPNRAWLVKVDPNGNQLWSKTYGGSWAISVQQTADGGYILAGAGGIGIYLAKTDADGNMIWQNSYDAARYEDGRFVQQTSDGGYIATGVAYGGGSVVLLKTDPSGNQDWLKFSRTGGGEFVCQLPTGEYITSSWTDSKYWGPLGHGGLDFNLSKYNSSGDYIWNKAYGGASDDELEAAVRTSDGGYILTGRTRSFGASGNDIYVVKTDENGDLLWEKTFGGAGNDYAFGIAQTSDGGYIITGSSSSFGEPHEDLYVLKIIEIEGHATIEGKVYYDKNGDCSFTDGIDIPLANRIIQAAPGPYMVFSDNNGDYQIRLPQGEYEVTQVSAPDSVWNQECPSESGYTVTSIEGEIVSGMDFGNELLGDEDTCCPEYFVSSIDMPSEPCIGGPCPGRNQKYCYRITNCQLATGNIENQEVTFHIDNDMQFVNWESGMGSCTYIPDLPLPSETFGGQVIFNSSTAIGNNGVCEICITVLAGVPASGNYLIHFQSKADCSNHNAKLTDNNRFFDPVACPCDPNDKAVIPQGCGPFGNVNKDERFTYRIRFQNVGYGPAHDVIIKDILDSDLDISTFRLLSSSHTITHLQLYPGNELVISLEGIELPDSTADFEGSHGSIHYVIEPKADLPDGTEITNHADIYFDNNEAVTTNTTLNTLRETPNPEANFSSNHQCASTQLMYDFTYSGGTPDNAAFEWNFGPNAMPSESTEMNPGNILFNNPGENEVTLTITRYGCTMSVTKIVNVADVRCGKNNKKVIVCHKGHEICIGENAVPAHLDHGDCVGPCLE